MCLLPRCAGAPDLTPETALVASAVNSGIYHNQLHWLVGKGGFEGINRGSSAGLKIWPPPQ